MRRFARRALTCGTPVSALRPSDLSHVFDRFHRIERAAARTHEGSGIGLALVRELVEPMHGGIGASSVPGEGTVFSVRSPGRRGPPSGRSRRRGRFASPLQHRGLSAAATRTWRKRCDGCPQTRNCAARRPPAARQSIDASMLMADDNADMRDYLARVVGGDSRLKSVGDGSRRCDAVRAAPSRRDRQRHHDAGLDGFSSSRLYAPTHSTATVPFILLSARAGEEARIEGLHAGADDYLVKPFSARELWRGFSRRLVRAKVRSLEEAHVLRLASIFAHAPVGVAHPPGSRTRLRVRQPPVRRPGREPSLSSEDRRAGAAGAGRAGHLRAARWGLRVGCALCRAGSALRRPWRADDTSEETFFDFVYQPLFER